MKSIKIMLSAFLLTLSMGSYAQVEEDVMDVESETEVAEAEASDMPMFYHRVYGGFVGTATHYENFGYSPDYNNYFLKGINVGWAAGIHIAKKLPLYLELGAEVGFHAGASKGDSIMFNESVVGNDLFTKYHYNVKALTLNIPINVTYQFKDAFIEGLTLAPFIGVHARFNVIADKKMTTTKIGRDGNVLEETSVTKSLMEVDQAGKNGWAKGRLQRGKLAQVGAQVGVNAIYKNYTFGIAYMRDLTPFISLQSEKGIEVTNRPENVGGVNLKPGVEKDLKVTTNNAFAISVGYKF